MRRTSVTVLRDLRVRQEKSLSRWQANGLWNIPPIFKGTPART